MTAVGTVAGMKRRTRYLVALGLGFVTYRMAVAVIDDTFGAAYALVMGVIVALSVWALTASRQAS